MRREINIKDARKLCQDCNVLCLVFCAYPYEGRYRKDYNQLKINDCVSLILKLGATFATYAVITFFGGNPRW